MGASVTGRNVQVTLVGASDVTCYCEAEPGASTRPVATGVEPDKAFKGSFAV